MVQRGPIITHDKMSERQSRCPNVNQDVPIQPKMSHVRTKNVLLQLHGFNYDSKNHCKIVSIKIIISFMYVEQSLLKDSSGVFFLRNTFLNFMHTFIYYHIRVLGLAIHLTD